MKFALLRRASAFVPLGSADLDTILCHEETRIVARDNTVSVDGRTLQIAPQPGRRSCTGLTVTVRHHLDGRITINQGARLFGTFAAADTPMDAAAPVDAREKPRAPTRRLDRRPQAPAPHKRPQASL